jgi:MFS family permease
MLEYLPSSRRASIIIVIELFWSLGSIFEYLMAMFIVPTYGWRLLTILSALPISIVAACMYVSIQYLSPPKEKTRDFF